MVSLEFHSITYLLHGCRFAPSCWLRFSQPSFHRHWPHQCHREFTSGNCYVLNFQWEFHGIYGSSVFWSCCWLWHFQCLI